MRKPRLVAGNTTLINWSRGEAPKVAAASSVVHGRTLLRPSKSAIVGPGRGSKEVFHRGRHRARLRVALEKSLLVFIVDIVEIVGAEAGARRRVRARRGRGIQARGALVGVGRVAPAGQEGVGLYAGSLEARGALIGVGRVA